jgi:hypothetical protein
MSLLFTLFAWGILIAALTSPKWVFWLYHILRSNKVEA